MGKNIDFREIIAAELDRQGKTRYWLASQDGAPPVNSVYDYLAGNRDMGGDGVASLLSILGLEVRPVRRR